LLDKYSSILSSASILIALFLYQNYDQNQVFVAFLIFVVINVSFISYLVLLIISS
jgi:hypothetical protein